MPDNTHTKSGRESYTLLDKGFFYGLDAISRVLDEAAEGRYALYGGTGIQTHFSQRLAHGESIDTIPELQEVLRPTSDFDIAVPRDFERRKAISSLLGLKREDEYDDELYQSRIIRNGAKRPVFSVKRTTNVGEYETIIALNLHNEDDRHTEMIDERARVHLLYTPVTLNVSVAPLEYTITGKLARASLMRDIPDITKTLELFPETDLTKVADILKSLEGKEPHVRKMLSRVRGGRGLLLDYLRKIERMSG